MNNKNKFKEIAPLIIVVLLTALVVAAILLRDGEKNKSKILYGYFDTVTVITDYGGVSAEEFSDICLTVEEGLKYYHRLFDIYNEYSDTVNLCKINKLAGDGPIEIDAELFAFLEYCRDTYTLTRGEVNVCMGAVLSLWHEFRSDYSKGAPIPQTEQLSALYEHCNIDHMILDRANMTVELTDPEMSLDVGAVAKGYAAQKIVDKLKDKGISGVTLDVGGNICLVGEKPSGDGWITGIENPDKSSDQPHVMTFTASDTSVVTSGDYQRYVTVDGKRYHHIIDKDTLYPSSFFSSVSVVCRDSGLADALSTALFSMSYEDGLALVESLPEVQLAVWVTPSGEVLTAKDMEYYDE
ncbi:MAG: FAD:protein FMN transferase [Clostridia bacterium]|nr:FAD:protein FMN transferase [Clostridia bacterium]